MIELQCFCNRIRELLTTSIRSRRMGTAPIPGGDSRPCRSGEKRPPRGADAVRPWNTWRGCREGHVRVRRVRRWDGAVIESRRSGTQEAGWVERVLPEIFDFATENAFGRRDHPEASSAYAGVPYARHMERPARRVEDVAYLLARSETPGYPRSSRGVGAYRS